MTLPEIKRIEVLKGPASVLYGFNAFDGIVNIITKSADEMKGTTLQFGGGEFGTISSAAIHAGTSRKTWLSPLCWRRSKSAMAKFATPWHFAHTNSTFRQNMPCLTMPHFVFSGGVVDANRFDGTITETVSVSITARVELWISPTTQRHNSFLRAWWNGSNIASNFASNPLLSAISNSSRLSTAIPTRSLRRIPTILKVSTPFS